MIHHRLLMLSMLLMSSAAFADDLPIPMQVRLLSKMGSYIPALEPASQQLKILVLHPGGAPSRSATAIAHAVAQIGTFGASKAEAKLVPFSDAAALKSLLAAENPQVLYLAAEFDETTVQTIANSAGKVVTVASASAHPRLGIILGFSLLEARPRVLVNLARAREGGVEFKNRFLAQTIVVDK